MTVGERWKAVLEARLPLVPRTALSMTLSFRPTRLLSRLCAIGGALAGHARVNSIDCRTEKAEEDRIIRSMVDRDLAHRFPERQARIGNLYSF